LTITTRGGGETRNTETEVVRANIVGGIIVEVALGRFSTLPNINTIITTIKRE
jgi:hypothetical protein